MRTLLVVLALFAVATVSLVLLPRDEAPRRVTVAAAVTPDVSSPEELPRGVGRSPGDVAARPACAEARALREHGGEDPAPAPDTAPSIPEDVRAEARGLAAALDLDRATEERVARLLARTLDDVRAQVRALREHGPDVATPEAIEAVVLRRQEAFHDSVERLLDPERVSRYRTFVGR